MSARIKKRLRTSSTSWLACFEMIDSPSDFSSPAELTIISRKSSQHPQRWIRLIIWIWRNSMQTATSARSFDCVSWLYIKKIVGSCQAYRICGRLTQFLPNSWPNHLDRSSSLSHWSISSKMEVIFLTESLKQHYRVTLASIHFKLKCCRLPHVVHTLFVPLKPSWLFANSFRLQMLHIFFKLILEMWFTHC